jgi:C-terminal processing protease CtpA/Prc
MSEYHRTRALNILRDTVQIIKSNYYDPSLHGSELFDRAKLAEEKIVHSPNLNAAYSAIAWVVDGVNDSHTRFIPPSRATRTDRGWTAAAIGDHCLITGVRPGSDAEAQGLKPGDELVSIDGIRATPELFSKLEYELDVLTPHSVHELLIASPGCSLRKLKVKVEFVNVNQLVSNRDDRMQLIRKWELDDELNKPRSMEVDDVVIFQIPSFSLSDNKIDGLFKNAEKHSTVIFDIRNNLGGPQDALTHMLGHLFDHKIKVCDRIARKSIRPLMAKPHGHSFGGKVVVLVDSASASSAEIFARVVQLEGRGVVIGDHSSGQAMESVSYMMHEGLSLITIYTVQVTTGNLIMTDGKSLERNPVVPDEVLLPTPEDLAAGRDPVLAHAVEVGGAKVSPEKAGTFFPHIWRRL